MGEILKGKLCWTEQNEDETELCVPKPLKELGRCQKMKNASQGPEWLLLRGATVSLSQSVGEVRQKPDTALRQLLSHGGSQIL